MYMFSGEISKLLNYLKKYYSYQLKRVELKKKKNLIIREKKYMD